ncbi:uncharacterized protein EDB93DRAFT_1151124, partial [Suillus bovinus]|uniref:uncharacterized protein n=1 Tax=Suillus bovinus TaxID=48563 RepID=UPI001B85CB24
MGTRQFHLSHWRVSGIFSSPKAVSVSLLALIFWPAYWTLMVLCSGHGMLSDAFPHISLYLRWIHAHIVSYILYSDPLISAGKQVQVRVRLPTPTGLHIWTFQLLCALHLPVCCRNT